MNSLAWGPAKTWSWNGLKKDEGYYNKYKIEYWGKSRKASRRWGFQINGTGSEANNLLAAAWRAWRFKTRRDKEIRARHNR